MRVRYFAYGSNLKLARIRGRVPSAVAEGAAQLAGYRLVCDKRGSDGTGKANLRAEPGSVVWGVVYALDAGELALLDAHEPGYERLEVAVSRGGLRVAAQTYRSSLLVADPVPVEWYKELVVDGAREHGLPEDWIRALEAWPTARRS